MTTLERLARAALLETTIRIGEIDTILEANPIVDLIKLRQSAKPLLTKIAKAKEPNLDLDNELTELVEQERELIALAEKQQKSNELITEKADLQLEQQDLQNIIYRIEQGRGF